MTIRVIVELRAPNATAQGAMDMSAVEAAGLSELALDTSYEPVPIVATGVPEMVRAAAPQTFLVRGEVADEAAKTALEANPNVVKVYIDGIIAGFAGCGCSEGGSSPTTILEMASAASAGVDMTGADLFAAATATGLPQAPDLAVASPCPPTDCDWTTAKGTIADVARFLSCPGLWGRGIRGAGVVIGICDTGVDKSRIPQVIGGWTPNTDYPPGTDPGGHGSMCATDALGMCPEAKIFDIGLLKSTGDMTGFLSDAIAGFQWAINQYKVNKTPQILSNSWGMFQEAWAPDYVRDPNHPFTRKVLEAIDLGIIVTFAAGNCGQVCPSTYCGSDTGPGRSIWGANGHPRVITVGAANIRGEWIGYTSQGPAALDPKKPDFCAPSHFQGWTACDNGTSAANPVCAGVIGLLRGHDRTLNQDRVKKALQETAINLCSSGWDPHSGYGMINAERTFNKLFFGQDTLIHASWIHGTSIEAELTDQFVFARRYGFYSLFDGKPNTLNWFHYAIPTPVIVDSRRLRLDSIMLCFATDPDVTVTNIHVYDGSTRIQTYDGLALSGNHPFQRFDVLDRFVFWGINVSIGVRFGGAAGSHRIAFISVGGDFIK